MLLFAILEVVETGYRGYCGIRDSKIVHVTNLDVAEAGTASTGSACETPCGCCCVMFVGVSDGCVLYRVDPNAWLDGMGGGHRVLMTLREV